MRVPPVFSVLLATVACTTPGEAERERPTPETDPRVGAEQDRLCFQRNINAFSSYEGGDALVLRRGVDDHFLVTFGGPCPALGGAQRVGLTQDLRASGCLATGDRIWVSEGLRRATPFSVSSCLVSDIFAFDPDAGDDDR